jgi:hypothetical protein
MVPRFSLVKLLGVVVFATACAASTEPRGPQVRPSLIRVADCVGPARSLDPAIAATLPPRSGLMRPDDQWADLALRVPGGFAGVMYVDNKPVLMLTDPVQAAAAKQALAPEFVAFDINGAEVRKVRWDFAQLVDWFNYLMAQSLWRTATMTSSDKDEAINRIRLGVLDEDARDRLLEALAGMDLPCDLIAVEIIPPAVALPLRP